MAYFLQQLINGLTLGSIYGLIAIGYTMVYGIIGMINFAHGEIYMIGAFISVIAFLVLGLAGVTLSRWRWLVVLLVAMLFTSLYGWAVERIAYRPLRGSFRLAPLISAIGMSIFLQNYVQITAGRAGQADAAARSTAGSRSSRAAGSRCSSAICSSSSWLLTLVLMIGFTAMIAATPLGRAQRACEQDMRMASLLGVDVDRVISTTFVMGAALAAVAGLMVTLYYGVVDFFIGFLAGVKAFTAAVLGGIGSLPGAMLGGLLIGLIEAFWSGYFSVEYKDVSVFVVLVLVLVLRAERAARPARGGEGLMAVASGLAVENAGLRPAIGRLAGAVQGRGRSRRWSRCCSRCRWSVCKPMISAAARSACAPISTGWRSPPRRCSPAGSRCSCSEQRRHRRRAGQRTAARAARRLGQPPCRADHRRSAIAFAVALPFLPFSSRYLIDLGTTVLIYVMLGWGLNIVVGLAGLLDLGYVAFYAVGAYTFALLARDLGLRLLGGAAVFRRWWRRAFGILLGFPVLRLRGDYLAIVTLGFGEIIRIVLLNWAP